MKIVSIIGFTFASIFLHPAFSENSSPAKLRVYEAEHPENPEEETSDELHVASVLQSIGVRFEKWPLLPFSSSSTNDDILKLYQEQVLTLVHENGYQWIDVVRIDPNTPKKEELRCKFLKEHTHREGEVRFFVEGSGLFYLHVGQKVYVVLCEEGDLISIPAGYPHWFDMGSMPKFTAIRFFLEPNGWIAQFTDDAIADRFPKYEE
jgi:1,2-dihydroxy-3-keto-5-methylthiopentene dioxygenase